MILNIVNEFDIYFLCISFYVQKLFFSVTDTTRAPITNSQSNLILHIILVVNLIVLGLHKCHLFNGGGLFDRYPLWYP